MFSWIGLSALICVVAVVMVGVHVVQRCMPHHLRREHNDVAGFIFGAIAAFYAILVAFVIVSLWASDEGARQLTNSEANDLGAVYWLSREMPLAQGAPLERLTLAYAHTVIGQEWPLLARRQSSPAATRLIYEMRDQAFAMNPVTPRDQIIYQEVTSSITALAADRRTRLGVMELGVPFFLWIALIGGGVIVVGFTFFFGVPTRTHAIMAGLFAVVVAASLVLIYDLNYPYAGPGRIGPDAFEVFLSRLPPPR